YPTDDFLIQTIAFEEGWQKMDGTTALRFVRSRHGTNGEGSDFARAARQQIILLAVKDRLLSASTFLNPSRITKIMGLLSSNIVTNMSVWELARLGSYLPSINTKKITHHVLDESTDSPLYATTINGAYVLLPKNDDWGPVRRIAANVFAPTDENIAISSPNEDAPTFVRLEIQNGTEITGFAFTISQLLQSEGFEVVQVGNAADRNYTHTIIYDLTNGQKSEELEALRSALQADVSMSAAGWIYTNELIPTELSVSDEPAKKKTSEEDIDFLIILGENTANLVLR
ncbi:MAG: LCP family protein, partial [Patescibacteria group bacterium]